MAKYGVTNIAGGGGIGSDEISVTKEYVLDGKTYLGADTDDEIGTGTMDNNGTTENQSLNAGGSFSVKKGYHAKDFTVNANNLASQTQGTATSGSILNGDSAYVNGSKVTGSMPNYSSTPTAIDAIRINNNRFEVAVAKGFHGYSWAGGGYEYMSYDQVANAIGLTPNKLKKGEWVCGRTGSFQGYVPTANDLYLRGKSNISSWVYIQSEDFHFETGMIYAYNPGSGTPTIGASINLTGYNYLNAEVMCTSSSFFDLSINESDLFSKSITSTSLTLNANTVTTISLNISAISATRVFGLGIANNRHYYIYRIWLS